MGYPKEVYWAHSSIYCNLYVNDIMDCDIASDLNMFADDTAVVAHGKVLADVVSQVNHDMTKLHDWLVEY